MKTREYYNLIEQMLLGQTEGLEDISIERLDWGGSGAVLELYDRTESQDRENLIRALGQIIEEGSAEPSVIAQVIHIVSSLDLAQVEASVRKLQAKTHIASQEPIASAIANYFAFRKLMATQRQQSSWQGTRE